MESLAKVYCHIMRETKNRDELLRELEHKDLKDFFFAEGDKKWADKLTERIVYALCTLILTGAIVAILSLIFRKS